MPFRRVLPWNPDLLAIILLTLLGVFYFWRLYPADKADQLIIDPHGDFSGQYYNFSGYQAQRFHDGTWLPLWNPYNFAGGPFSADPQVAAAYPVRWLFLSFYPDWSYFALEMEVVFHYWLTGALMYILVRRISGYAIGGLTASIVFTYGGYLNSYPVEQITILESGSWLPLALIGIHEGTREGPRRLRWFIIGGIGMSLVVLGGHPQIAFFCCVFSLAYLVYRIAAGSKSWTHFAAGAGLFIGIGLGLAAVLWLPGYEFHRLSTRGEDLHYTAKAVGYAFQNVFQLFWATGNMYTYWYISLISLILGGFALYYQRSKAVFWLTAGVIGLLFGFGGRAALFRFAYAAIPGFSLFRQQERSLVVWTTCAAILAGIGAVSLVTHFAETERKKLRYAVWGIAAGTFVYFLFIYNNPDGPYVDLNKEMAGYTLIIAVLAAAVIPWVARQPTAGRQMVLVGLLIFDMVSVTQANMLSYAEGSPETAVPPPNWSATLRPLLTADPFARVDTPDWTAGVGSLYALPHLEGFGPLRLKNSARLLSLPRERYWDLFAVRYVVTTETELPVPARRLPDSIVDWTGENFIYELENPRPLATLIYAADIIADSDHALAALAASDYPLRERLILSEAPPLALAGEPPESAVVTPVSIEPEHLRLHAATDANALLLLSIPYHPGWKATADGEKLRVMRADVGLMAIPLEPGAYDLKLDYRPTSVRIGLIITLATLVLAVIGLVIGFAPLRRRAAQRPISADTSASLTA